MLARPGATTGGAPPHGGGGAEDARDLATELEALAEIAATVGRVPLAAVCVLDAHGAREVTATAGDGLPAALDPSLIGGPGRPGDPLVLPDARDDRRWRDHPVVTGPTAVRYLVRLPLRDRDGALIGLVHLYDTEPRDPADPAPRQVEDLGRPLADLLAIAVTHHAAQREQGRLEERDDELVQANDRLSAFAGQVSHDLLTPLAGLSMSVDLIEDELHGDADRQQLAWFVARARRGNRRMHALVEELLTYATQGGVVAEHPVDLDLLLAEVVDDLGPATRHAQVLTGRLPVVIGDAVQLRCLLQNLVGNAVKFARPGVPAVVQVGARSVGDVVRVEVADNGRGVPDELDLAALLDPLVRGDATVPGAGLGLATCRRIASAHGGRLGLERRPEGGLLVWFELPAPGEDRSDDPVG